MLNAQCLGKDLLDYENLSTENRTNAIFSISVIAMVIFMIMVALCWYLNTKRRYMLVFLNNSVVVFGTMTFSNL
jgi:intracellular septation protein A